jgi:hypothetical protein
VVCTYQTGYRDGTCSQGGDVYRRVDLHSVKQRVVIAYGGLAAVIVLIGAAFGAFRRKPKPAGDSTQGAT